jgi:hypothetical protein
LLLLLLLLFSHCKSGLFAPLVNAVEGVQIFTFVEQAKGFDGVVGRQVLLAHFQRPLGLPFVGQ